MQTHSYAPGLKSAGTMDRSEMEEALMSQPDFAELFSPVLEAYKRFNEYNKGKKEKMILLSQ
jgi:hypothetical protein